MTKTVQLFFPSPHPCALMRKKRLLELVPFSKTTLHAKLTEGGRYADPSFPRPIYLPHSRTPFWRESEVLSWIEACALSSRTRETSEDAGQDANAVRSSPATVGKTQPQGQSPCERRPGDEPGELASSERHKRFETHIDGRLVTSRKRRSFIVPRVNASSEVA